MSPVGLAWPSNGRDRHGTDWRRCRTVGHLISVATPIDRSFQSTATLFALWLLVFTAASQTIIITPILPLIGEALGADAGALGLLVSVYSWVLAFAALVMGPISDRIGRRRVLLIGSGALAVALALHGFADTFGSLLAMRVLAGAGGGVLSGAAVSYVGDAFPYEKRGWATGWVMSGVPFGLVIGIPLGRALAVAAGFRAPFVVFAGVMAVAFALILLVVPQPNVPLSETRPTVGGALRLYRQLLAEGGTAAAAATYFLMYLGLGLLIVYLPQWLTNQFALEVTVFGRPLEVFGLPLDLIATLFLVGGIVSVIVSPRAGTLSDSVGRKPMILASCAGLAVVTAALTYVVTERWLAYVLYVAIMALFSLRMAPLQALLTALVPSSQRGAFLSLTIAVGQIGTGVGAALGGVLYADYGYVSNTWASAVAIVAMAVLVWTWLPEPDGEMAEHPVAVEA
ncbi:MFS transporter [Rubrivirga sp. IMCC45206]|uniref:MFS transporter n=1 Tax=Rubrivirga sp. IMCC45206 TaxID=3391614 RepID=UPI00398FBC43